MSDNETDSTETRYPYTNDVLAAVLVLAAVAATAAYLYRGESVPVWLTAVDSMAILTAVAWAFGAKAFAKAAEYVAGKEE